MYGVVGLRPEFSPLRNNQPILSGGEQRSIHLYLNRDETLHNANLKHRNFWIVGDRGQCVKGKWSICDYKGTERSPDHLSMPFPVKAALEKLSIECQVEVTYRNQYESSSIYWMAISVFGIPYVVNQKSYFKKIAKILDEGMQEANKMTI